MSRPHPANAAARRAVRNLLRDANIGPGSRLLIAVSGGSDSVALAAAAPQKANAARRGHHGLFR